VRACVCACACVCVCTNLSLEMMTDRGYVRSKEEKQLELTVCENDGYCQRENRSSVLAWNCVTHTLSVCESVQLHLTCVTAFISKLSAVREKLPLTIKLLLKLANRHDIPKAMNS